MESCAALPLGIFVRMPVRIHVLALVAAFLLATALPALAAEPAETHAAVESAPALLKRLSGEAGKGDAGAAFELYDRIREGRGLRRDARQSAKWLRKAAELGLAEAQFRLGAELARGQDSDKAPAQAALWFRKAAEQGHAGDGIGMAPERAA